MATQNLAVVRVPNPAAPRAISQADGFAYEASDQTLIIGGQRLLVKGFFLDSSDPDAPELVLRVAAPCFVVGEAV